MGAYDSLKSLVRQYIKTNGQNEITGQILQNVLIAMIDELGITIDSTPTNDSPNAVASGGVYNALKAITDFLNNGYYFVGIAGTSTVPDSVTQYGIFYIASDGGAYTNFLNGDDEPLTLYQGLNILYKDVEDDGWNYFEVFKFSDFVDTTRQQSLSSQQKSQARTNIAAVSYDQQSLSADQKVQAQNNVIGKSYVPSQNSGLGKVYLAKNNGALTQSMMQAAKTVYVIQYDYTMSGNITMPAGCTLEFDGGSISSGNYTLTGDNTRIKAERTNIFPVTNIAGTWNVGDIYSEWFGDVGQNNKIKKLFALTDSNITNNVYIAAGTYNVSAFVNDDAIIVPKSNTIVHLSGTIELAGNSFGNYYIVNIENVSNVTFEGGNIIGDRDTHTGTTGEWGMGINIGDAHDITVKNVNVTKCWGDGIYVGGSGNTYNISIDSFTISDCRRQGISVTEVDNATINNGKISKIDGTLPKACVDIEPNANDITRNITLSNLYCDNYSAGEGRGIILYGVVGTIENINIKSCNIVAAYSLSIEKVTNISVDSTYVNGTLHVKANSKNVSIKSSEFVVRYLDMVNYESVSFTNCRFAFSIQDVSIPSCHMDSCNISVADYVLSVYASTNNCTIESNKYIDIHDSTHKNLKIVSTKSNDINSYPVRFYNSNVEKLDVEMKDSEAAGTFYAYIYGEYSKIDVVNLKSEVKPTLLCYSGGNLVLNDVSFAQETATIYTINETKGTMIVPHGCSRVGTTAQRPALLYKGIGVKGFEYFDLTLKKPTYWTADTSGGKSGWVDATGADVPNPQS